VVYQTRVLLLFTLKVIFTGRYFLLLFKYNFSVLLLLLLKYSCTVLRTALLVFVLVLGSSSYRKFSMIE